MASTQVGYTQAARGYVPGAPAAITGQSGTYLDLERLAQIEAAAPDFLARKPYPWQCIQGFIRNDAFARLVAELPGPEMFEPQFGLSRAHGQTSHDRFALQYSPKLDPHLAPGWRDFIGELHSDTYRRFLRRVYGLRPNERLELSMHWHHAPSGASVSPHTDARRKVGSHIFYFNTPEDWDPAWGGQTLVLDDKGLLEKHSSPPLDSLRQAGASELLGNQSFMFKRTDHSWHAVRAIECPPGHLRKVFIVVINRINFQVIWRRMRGKDPDGYRL